jgi:integrase
MLIHVHQDKGSRDRDLPLKPKLLEALREYWQGSKYKPGVYLFPRGIEPIRPERPISDKVIWNACHEAALRAGSINGSAHTLCGTLRHTTPPFRVRSF